MAAPVEIGNVTCVMQSKISGKNRNDQVNETMPESQQITEYSADKNNKLVDDSIAIDPHRMTSSGEKLVSRMAEKS
jgi:hypothetical protein